MFLHTWLIFFLLHCWISLGQDKSESEAKQDNIEKLLASLTEEQLYKVDEVLQNRILSDKVSVSNVGDLENINLLTQNNFGEEIAPHITKSDIDILERLGLSKSDIEEVRELSKIMTSKEDVKLADLINNMNDDELFKLSEMSLDQLDKYIEAQKESDTLNTKINEEEAVPEPKQIVSKREAEPEPEPGHHVFKREVDPEPEPGKHVNKREADPEPEPEPEPKPSPIGIIDRADFFKKSGNRPLIPRSRVGPRGKRSLFSGGLKFNLQAQASLSLNKHRADPHQHYHVGNNHHHQHGVGYEAYQYRQHGGGGGGYRSYGSNQEHRGQYGGISGGQAFAYSGSYHNHRHRRSTLEARFKELDVVEKVGDFNSTPIKKLAKMVKTSKLKRSVKQPSYSFSGFTQSRLHSRLKRHIDMNILLKMVGLEGRSDDPEVLYLSAVVDGQRHKLGNSNV